MPAGLGRFRTVIRVGRTRAFTPADHSSSVDSHQDVVEMRLPARARLKRPDQREPDYLELDPFDPHWFSASAREPAIAGPATSRQTAPIRWRFKSLTWTFSGSFARPETSGRRSLGLSGGASSMAWVRRRAVRRFDRIKELEGAEISATYVKLSINSIVRLVPFDNEPRW